MSDETKTTEQPAEQGPPRVRLIPIKESWTCPNTQCGIQNVAFAYERANGDSPSYAHCSNCKTKVQLGVVRVDGRVEEEAAQWTLKAAREIEQYLDCYFRLSRDANQRIANIIAKYAPRPDAAQWLPIESHADALEQTLKFLNEQEGKSHQGYFFSGWAGTQLKALLLSLREAVSLPPAPNTTKEG